MSSNSNSLLTKVSVPCTAFPDFKPATQSLFPLAFSSNFCLVVSQQNAFIDHSWFISLRQSLIFLLQSIRIKIFCLLHLLSSFECNITKLSVKRYCVYMTMTCKC